MGTRTWMFAAAVSVTLASTSVARAAYWTGWISEEAPNNQMWCNTWEEAFGGVACSGRYCDNMSFLCMALPGGMTLDAATDHWTQWFSEETNGDVCVTQGAGFGSTHCPNERYCNSFVPGTIDSFGPAVVGGMACSGRFCDNIRLECDVPVHTSDWSWGRFSNCSWTTTWFSEEQGSVFFGGKFVVGVRCNGSFCDNKQFYTCNVN